MRRSLTQPALVLRSIRLARVTQPHFSRWYATPVEYKPQEKDPQLGDYPQLPWVSNQLRPPKGWWDNQMRRNYGEVVCPNSWRFSQAARTDSLSFSQIHEEDDALNMWSPDAPPPVEPSFALGQFTLAAIGITAFAYYVYHNVPERPSIPREYPFSGLIKELGGLEENKACRLSYSGYVKLTFSLYRLTQNRRRQRTRSEVDLV